MEECREKLSEGKKINVFKTKSLLLLFFFSSFLLFFFSSFLLSFFPSFHLSFYTSFSLKALVKIV